MIIGDLAITEGRYRQVVGLRPRIFIHLYHNCLAQQIVRQPYKKRSFVVAWKYTHMHWFLCGWVLFTYIWFVTSPLKHGKVLPRKNASAINWWHFIISWCREKSASSLGHTLSVFYWIWWWIGIWPGFDAKGFAWTCHPARVAMHLACMVAWSTRVTGATPGPTPTTKLAVNGNRCPLPSKFGNVDLSVQALNMTLCQRRTNL